MFICVNSRRTDFIHPQKTPKHLFAFNELVYIVQKNHEEK